MNRMTIEPPEGTIRALVANIDPPANEVIIPGCPVHWTLTRDLYQRAIVIFNGTNSWPHHRPDPRHAHLRSVPSPTSLCQL